MTPQPNNPTSPQVFTAAQIALALGKSPQAVRRHLCEVHPTGTRIVGGNEAAAWSVEQLPTPLKNALAGESVRSHCAGDDMVQRIETLLAMPRTRWKPPVPMDKICDADIQLATNLRDALRPWLAGQHDSRLSCAEIESRGVADYKRIFGNSITTRYWRELFMRTIRRDNGAEEWNRLEIYLPDRLKQKTAPTAIVSEALAADFAEIESFIAACSNPHVPNKAECAGIWTLALEKFSALVHAGELDKRASRRVRQFLFARAPFLASSRDALWIAWQRKLERFKAANGDAKALRDGRENNGDRVVIPASDLDLLRHAAAVECGGRINTAWRSKYVQLSDTTRGRYPDQWNCPAKVYDLVNRELVDALYNRHHGGKRAVRRMIGGLHGDRWANIPSMHSWVVDDVTSNIEVAFKNSDSSTSLILPQIIAVMDSASRKWVGWSISNDKAPTAELVCDAVLDGFRRNNIPKQLWVENGFVFGKSLLINGKTDEMERTVVSGLAQYGCTIHHFGKMNPQAKAELERSFEAVQRLMEPHPGYTGRHQMIDAPEDFKREQRLILSGKVEATKFRYTLDEFKLVMARLIAEYNSTPQHGHLKGLSPDEAFAAMQDASDPPIEYDPQLEWLFSNEKSIVEVRTGGVKFSHRSTGRTIRVRGGQLADLIGKELWAWVDRKDASMVTFMDLDFANPFTMEVCQTPSAREASMAPGGGVLAKEIAKIREHERAVDEEYNRLINQYGNPRRKLLADIRGPASPIHSTITDGTRRVAVVNGQLAESAEQMEQQRVEIRAGQQERQRQHSRAQRLMRRHGIVNPEGAPPVCMDDLNFLDDFMRVKGNESGEDGKFTYYLKSPGGGKAEYVDYLVGRLVQFRKAGASFGQHFQSKISVATVTKIAERQLNCNLHDQSRFDEVCAYLKAKIDATILGKRNSSKGTQNYHDFCEPKEAL
jgi:hypothetical protein